MLVYTSAFHIQHPKTGKKHLKFIRLVAKLSGHASNNSFIIFSDTIYQIKAHLVFKEDDCIKQN